MLTVMSNVKIGRKMLIAASAPLLGLAAYAGILFSERFETAREMEKVSALSLLTPRISAVVHEMQRERGQSAGFIASKGTNFAATLPDQRRATDQRRTDLLSALGSFDFARYGEDFGKKMDTATDRLGKLDDRRRAIDGFDMSVPEMAEYYTGTISRSRARSQLTSTSCKARSGQGSNEPWGLRASAPARSHPQSTISSSA